MMKAQQNADLASKLQKIGLKAKISQLIAKIERRKARAFYRLQDHMRSEKERERNHRLSELGLELKNHANYLLNVSLGQSICERILLLR
jgi:hypothetical protein